MHTWRRGELQDFVVEYSQCLHLSRCANYFFEQNYQNAPRSLANFMCAPEISRNLDKYFAISSPRYRYIPHSPINPRKEINLLRVSLIRFNNFHAFNRYELANEILTKVWFGKVKKSLNTELDVLPTYTDYYGYNIITRLGDKIDITSI